MQPCRGARFRHHRIAPFIEQLMHAPEFAGKVNDLTWEPGNARFQKRFGARNVRQVGWNQKQTSSQKLRCPLHSSVVSFEWRVANHRWQAPSASAEISNVPAHMSEIISLAVCQSAET